MAAWAEARRAGDVPGAYWALLTHPEVGAAGIRQAFGDVHMLSHLVGAANRADIKRLTALEADNAELRSKVERQQQRRQHAVTSRDATIRRLGSLAANRPARLHWPVDQVQPVRPPEPAVEAGAGRDGQLHLEGADRRGRDERYGRENGKQHVEEFLNVRAVWIKTA